MTPTRHRIRSFAAAALLALLLAGLVAGPASAQTGTITAQACAQGRIRDQSGNPIPRARCDQLIGQSVQLASTGFDAWILGLVGVACVGGALVLMRSRGSTARS